MLVALIVRWIVIALAVGITAWLMPGMQIQNGITGLLLISLVFGLINAIIKPIVKLLTCPLIILTLGLCTLVINSLMLLLTAKFLPQYLLLDGFWAAFWASIVISIVTAIIGFIIPDGD